MLGALALVPPAVVRMAPHRHSPCVGSCPRPSSPFIPRGSFLPLHGYVQLQHRTLTGVTGEKWLGHVYWEGYVRFVVRNPQLSDETFYWHSAFVPGVIVIGLLWLGSLSLTFSSRILGLSGPPNHTSLRLKRAITLPCSCKTSSPHPLWAPGNECKGLSMGKARAEPFLQNWP